MYKKYFISIYIFLYNMYINCKYIFYYYFRSFVFLTYEYMTTSSQKISCKEDKYLDT